MRKIIGLDYGHCDITAATPVFKDGKFDHIDDLYLDGEKNKVISAEVEVEGEMFIYFKASPEHFEEIIVGETVEVTRRKLMFRHFKEIMTAIRKYNSNISKDDRILLIVGCPTSNAWMKASYRKEYEALIKEATGVEAVRVVPESRAAMFSALADRKGRMITANEGAAVFDLGSSTGDGTYMKTGETCIEFSWNLGAREIEKQLRIMMCKEAEQTANANGTELKDVDNYAKLERKLRKTKEAYYSNKLDEDDCEISYRFATVQNKKVIARIDVDDDTMEEALQADLGLVVDGRAIVGGWKECCKKFFEEGKRQIEKSKHQVKEIVLTGGASKMKFVEEYAKEVFPKDKYNVTCSANPSFSVSNGLVWVGLVDEQEEEIVMTVAKAIESDKDCKLRTLKDAIRPAGDQLLQAIYRGADEWADFYADLSLNHLKSFIENNISNCQSDIETIMKKSIGNWTKNMTGNIRGHLENQVKINFGDALAQTIMMPESKWDSLLNSAAPISLDTYAIVKNLDVNSLMRKTLQWVLIIVYALIGTAILPFIGSLIGAGIGAILAADIDDDDLEKLRSSNTRKKAQKSIKEDKDLMIKCYESIYQCIDDCMTEDSLKKDIQEITRMAYRVMTLKSLI